ncbi:hypothetical protein GCM10010250_21820 [Streptomyces althioticus]|uniref:DUF3560 domain-containing protein n=1 Tax=Streptomyces althioticus TaxID=83380 RepID=UPI0018743706|nr:hypothetical protein GCM10010250_21820 [Streptomyces althioticus]
MATTTPAKTPSTAIARALRRLGLTQGSGKDFRVEGEYNEARERVATRVLLLTRHADETVAARADDIEQWTSEDGGWSFTVCVRYSDSGRPHCTISNGPVDKIREQPPAPPATSPAPTPGERIGYTCGTDAEGAPFHVNVFHVDGSDRTVTDSAGGTEVLEGPAQPDTDEQPAPQEPQDEPPASKGSLTITHTRADGTLLEGSRKGDGVYQIVRPIGFRSSRLLSALYIQRSRDREADRWRINRAADALREAGWEVTVTIDEEQRRSFEEAEAERLERAAERTERFSDRAGRASAASAARHKAALGALDGIEPGQPILVGHHSERRHRRAIERSDSHMRKSIEESGKAEYYGHRAAAAEKYEERRYDPNRTRRRLDKLRAELRGLERRRDRTSAAGRDTSRTERLIRDVTEEIAHWEAVVEKARESGVKLWEADDFAPGDFALYSGTWYQVKRVNPKTLSIAWNLRLTKAVLTLEDATDGGSTWTFGIDYSKVKARCPEAAMTAFLADGKIPGTKSAWKAHEAQPASEVRAAQAAKPKTKRKKRSDPTVPKKIRVDCRWDATEARLMYLDGKGQPHPSRQPVTLQAPDGVKFTESVWSRPLLKLVGERLAADGFQYREGRWSGGPALGIVHAIEPAEAKPVDEPPAAAPEAAVAEPDPTPVDEPAERPVDQPEEDPKEVALQKRQAEALGWSAGHAELAIAAAAGRLYWTTDGELWQQDLPGTVGRTVALHRLLPLRKAGFLTVGDADHLRRRPVRVTADGRRAVKVWKRWRPKPVEMDRQQESEKLRPLLGGEQARRLAAQAAEEEARRKEASREFREAHDRLIAWEDAQDRMWAAWAKVNDVHFRLQRRPAGWVPTEEEIERHGLDPQVVEELRADAVNPQPKPVLPDLRQRPLEELPPLAPDAETPEQLDLFDVA